MQPQRALAALLWQRADLRALSPYQTSGDVRDRRMFFGRDMELRELTTAGKRRAVLVIGPRKVDKSSLLRRAAPAGRCRPVPGARPPGGPRLR